ncbi:response regulator [Nocardioides sp. MAHUQ-72]|uniref:response regulator n=1 Tax=unclassified Nocardioides TaxID=2615069 RepID=UPI00361E6309
MDLATMYRDVVETSPDGIWVFDLEGRTLYANRALATMFGADVTELMDLTVFDSLDEQGRGQFATHLEHLRRGELNPGDVECKFVRRDGSALWVLVRESALRGPDGEIVGIMHRLADFSDRRSTVESLTNSRRRLAEAQRIARIGSWEWDVVRDEISGSEGLYELYGLDPDDFPATYADFLEIVHPDDRHLVDEAVGSALRGADDFVFVARVLGADDEWVWTRGRGESHRDAEGRVVRMTGTHQDITETKLATMALEDSVTQNALMQAVATAANEAHTLEEVLSQAQSLVLLHDDWERARAFVPAADGHGVVPLYIYDEDREADAAQPERPRKELDLANLAFRERGSVWDDERLTIAFCISFADEVCAVITITSAPPLYRHDMITSMVEQVAVQLGRVAERERAERALASARDAAMEASRQKSEFLATMSHEIRTPLNGVIGLNDLLLRTRLDPEQTRLASGVQVASRALLGVINDVLDFSKIEAGKLQLERLDFEVRPVFDQVASLLSESARRKGLDLLVSCNPDVPEVLCGDPTRLAQVLTNLGSNAVKFTERGEVHVRATAESTADGGTLLRVEVSDTGVGIRESDVGGLFDPFTQADASTTRVYGGTGLGLAISREIVEALGGEIGLLPNPRGGSVFWFTARFAAPSGSRLELEDEYARERLGGRRVLVVDDNEHNRLILGEQLSWWQVRSTGVADADAALAALADAAAEGDPYVGLLLDMVMPREDGLELAERVRRDPAHDDLVILMLTSREVLDAARVRDARIADLLFKPVLAGTLRETLLQHLAGVPPRPVGGATAAPSVRTRRRVLVVEDNPVNQMVAVGMLEAIGYAAVTADDGRSAIDALAGDTYDAVLMDVQMPRMDGYAATREIRAHETMGHIPVIAMTAAAVEGERDRCLAAGMDDFLTKPVDPGALRTVLGRWLADDHSSEEHHPMPETPHPASAIDGLDLARLDELRDLDPGDTTYLDRAIGNFVANTPTTMATIRGACEAGDVETLRQVAHKLAGGALNLGVTPAGRIAQQIELAVESGSVAGAAELVDELEEALALGRSAVLAYQASYSTATAPAPQA